MLRGSESCPGLFGAEQSQNPCGLLHRGHFDPSLGLETTARCCWLWMCPGIDSARAFLYEIQKLFNAHSPLQVPTHTLQLRPLQRSSARSNRVHLWKRLPMELFLCPCTIPVLSLCSSPFP